MKKIYPWLAVITTVITLVGGVFFVIDRYRKLLSDLVKLDDCDFDDIDA